MITRVRSFLCLLYSASPSSCNFHQRRPCESEDPSFIFKVKKDCVYKFYRCYQIFNIDSNVLDRAIVVYICSNLNLFNVKVNQMQKMDPRFRKDDVGESYSCLEIRCARV